MSTDQLRAGTRRWALPIDGTLLLLLAAIVVALVVFSRLVPTMLTATNLLEILRQTAFIGVAAIGTTFVIIQGRIDLSIGSTITVAATTMALLLTRFGLPAVLGLFVPIAIGMLVGLINGLLTTKARVTSVIATLGTLIALAGAATLVIGGATISGLPSMVTFLGRERIGPVPVAIFVLLAVWLGAELVLRRTRFGRYCYHIGTNERAAWINGVRVDRYVIGAFVVGGALAGLAALMFTGRLLSANVDIGVGRELQAIAIVIIGGGSLFGGKGTATGTVLAALLISVLTTGLRLMNINVFWQMAVTGMVIIVAVIADAIRQKRLA